MFSRSAGFLKTVRNRAEYIWRRWKNEPIHFEWVENEEEAVGDPIDVYHLTLHDMMEHQACGVMTKRVLLGGLQANAIRVLSFERLNEWNGKTIIQPCLVGSPSLVTK